MTKRWVNVVKNLVFLGIGLALLYLAFRGNDLRALLVDLQQANYFWVGLSLLFAFGAYVSRAVRWLILLDPLGYKPRISISIYSIIIGYFANLAIPRIGELTRCTTMNRVERIPVDKLFGTVILERIIDLFILLFLTVLTVLLKIDVFGKFFYDLLAEKSGEMPNLIPLAISLIIVGVAGFVVLYRMRHMLRKLPKIHSFLSGLKEGVVSIRKIRKKGWFIFHTLLIWTFYYVMTYVCFFAIEATSSLTMADGLFILVVGGFGMAAPVQGGIGAYHIIVSMGLSVLNIAGSAALSYATIVHTSQTILVLLSGAISLILVYFMKKSPGPIPIST